MEQFRERLQQRVEAVSAELRRLEDWLQRPPHERPTVSLERRVQQQTLFAAHYRQFLSAAEELLQLAAAVDREPGQQRPAEDRRDDPDLLPEALQRAVRELAVPTATRSPVPAAAPTVRAKGAKIPHPDPADSGPTGPRYLLTRRLVQTEYEQYYAYRNPAAFELLGRTVRVSNWRELYLGVLQLLAEHDAATFRRLPHNPLFVTKTGQNDFSERPQVHRDPLALPFGLYVEGKRGAAQMAFRIGNLLDTFKIARGSFDIILAPR
jgi:hypothetical protein